MSEPCSCQIVYVNDKPSENIYFCPLHAAAPQMAEALRPGQREDGRLVFQVAVRGIGAKPYSAERVANELCQRWTEWMWQVYGPLANVRVEPAPALPENSEEDA